MADKAEKTPQERQQYFLRQAGIANGLASKSSDGAEREAFLRIASCWIELAAAAEGEAEADRKPEATR